MLSVRYLTHKLRSQSLNEEQHYHLKSDPDRDSGTESDDEQKPDELLSTSSKTMDSELSDLSSGGRRSNGGINGRERARSESGKENSCSSRPLTKQRRSERGLRERSETGEDRPDSPIEFCVTDSALPSDSDHPWGDQHSSEEELECINGPVPFAINSAFRFGPSAFGPPGQEKNIRRGKTPQQIPEKRKWSQVSPRRVITPGMERTRAKTRPRSAIFTSASAEGMEERSSSAALDFYSASSDDEVQALIGAQESPLPLEFCTSPPEGAHRPTRSLSPPPKLFLTEEESCLSVESQQQQQPLQHQQQLQPQQALAVSNGNAASPRKRHRHTPKVHNIQRPCLDFEKMQQMKNRSISTWRHDGELSLFCW